MGCWALLAIAVLHFAAMIDCVLKRDWPMAIVMVAFTISDLAFAWILIK